MNCWWVRLGRTLLRKKELDGAWEEWNRGSNIWKNQNSRKGEKKTKGNTIKEITQIHFSEPINMSLQIEVAAWVSTSEFQNTGLKNIYLQASREKNWRKTWQPTPVFLPGKSRRQRSLAVYSLCSHKGQTQESNWAHSTESKYPSCAKDGIKMALDIRSSNTRTQKARKSRVSSSVVYQLTLLPVQAAQVPSLIRELDPACCN